MLGGRWTSLRIGDLELLGYGEVPGAYPPILSGCFPMAPYAGRLGWGRADFRSYGFTLPVTASPHAIHGTVLDVPWQLVEAGQTTAVLSVPLAPPWPFRGTITQHLQLTPHALHARLTLSAYEDMPATLGFHPWFRRQLSRGGPVSVDLAGGRQYLRGPDGLPTGELTAPGPPPWDDCFVELSAPPRLHWPGALEVTFTSSHDTWVIFTELETAVCTEPQTGPPDALHLGLADIVPTGGSLTLAVSLSWQPPPESRI
ncbi:MAG: aldose 1-epimerase [Mycobacteriales bacterium]